MSTAAYVIEKCVRRGYRGGLRHDGWNVVRVVNGKHVYWSQWKDQAHARAARLNLLETPLTTAPALESDYWRLTDTGHWLYCWAGSPDDLVALREGRAFAAVEGDHR